MHTEPCIWMVGDHPFFALLADGTIWCEQLQHVVPDAGKLVPLVR